jgi:hypothetical protein
MLTCGLDNMSYYDNPFNISFQFSLLSNPNLFQCPNISIPNYPMFPSLISNLDKQNRQLKQ